MSTYVFKVLVARGVVTVRINASGYSAAEDAVHGMYPDGAFSHGIANECHEASGGRPIRADRPVPKPVFNTRRNMKKVRRQKTCCIHCGKDTWNKCRICHDCLSGEEHMKAPIENRGDKYSGHGELYGFSFVDRSWGGFSN